MKMIFHELELNAADVKAGRNFYHEVLGLPIWVDQEGLNVFDSGRPNISVHNPGKTSLSFLTDDLEAFI